jgi:GR25 family glycosyltransferase involved in LPS biosynthesis
MKTICINLDRRPDRLILFDAQANHYGIEYERFSAVDGKLYPVPGLNDGHSGCFQSHKELIERRETLLVLEDDAVLCPDFLLKVELCMRELPDDWGMLYLGGWRQDVEPYSDRLQVANRVLCTHAYVINGAYCERLLDQMHDPDKIDLMFSRADGKKFVANPVLAWQRDGYSDIENQYTNNEHLK